MAKVRKYIQGEQIKSPQEAIGLILAGEYLFFQHKVIHPGFFLSWQVRLLVQSCHGGRIRRAILNPEHPDNHKAASGMDADFDKVETCA